MSSEDFKELKKRNGGKKVPKDIWIMLLSKRKMASKMIKVVNHVIASGNAIKPIRSHRQLLAYTPRTANSKTVLYGTR